MMPHLEKSIESCAALVLNWLDMVAHDQGMARSPLVELFIDTLQALEQNKEQED